MTPTSACRGSADEPKAAVSARSIVWARRRRSWNMLVAQFRRSRQGMLGLTIFVIFAAIALLAPVLFDESQLDVTKATGGAFESPSGQFWLGTDDAGRNVLAMVVWGARISLLVGCAPPCCRWSSAPPSVSRRGTTADWSPEF